MMNAKNLMAIAPFVGIGLVVGIAIGAAMNNVGVGVALGLVFGAAIGFARWQRGNDQE